MAARLRRRRRNPGALRWLFDEWRGEHARQTLLNLPAPRRREPERTARPVAKTRVYEPVRAAPKKRYAVRVRDTHKARTREYSTIRKEDEFKDLADRAERGELTGDALAAFLNKYQVVRKRKGATG